MLTAQFIKEKALEYGADLVGIGDIRHFEGKVTGEFKSGEIDKMEISYYMTGHRETEGGEHDN